MLWLFLNPFCIGRSWRRQENTRVCTCNGRHHSHSLHKSNFFCGILTQLEPSSRKFKVIFFQSGSYQSVLSLVFANCNFGFWRLTSQSSSQSSTEFIWFSSMATKVLKFSAIAEEIVTRSATAFFWCFVLLYSITFRSSMISFVQIGLFLFMYLLCVAVDFRSDPSGDQATESLRNGF